MFKMAFQQGRERLWWAFSTSPLHSGLHGLHWVKSSGSSSRRAWTGDPQREPDGGPGSPVTPGP